MGFEFIKVVAGAEKEEEKVEVETQDNATS